MNHPTPEEWMTYLYAEVGTDERAALTSHLTQCTECRTRIDDWRRTTRALDAWKVPVMRQHGPAFHPVLQWAAAAAIVLAVGIGIGRATGPRAADTVALKQQMRAEFARMLRQELDQSASATRTASTAQTRELLREFAQYSEQNRAEDNRALYAALTRLEAQRVADFTEMRKDLETVALFSDTGLRQTQQRLVQLADYRPSATPVSSPTPSGNN